MTDLELIFSGNVWVYKGKGSWYFITLPKETAAQIKFLVSGRQRGWGTIRVTARINDTVWGTSLFPDSKLGSYILPLKADIRKREHIKADDTVTIHLTVAH